MSIAKNLIFLYLISFSTILLSADFPTGNYIGIGFVLEKGSMKINEADLNKYESKLLVIKQGKSKVSFTISATIQQYKNSPIKTDNRYDVFIIKWDSETSGSLINNNKTYSSDKSTFIIDGNKLTIKSWIARNQLYETHKYIKSEK